MDSSSARRYALVFPLGRTLGQVAVLAIEPVYKSAVKVKFEIRAENEP